MSATRRRFSQEIRYELCREVIEYLARGEPSNIPVERQWSPGWEPLALFGCQAPFMAACAHVVATGFDPDGVVHDPVLMDPEPRRWCQSFCA